MGNLKSQALKKDNEDIQSHQLTEQEANYLRLLAKTLVFHTYASNIQSGFLYYVCTNRLGYTAGVDLQFEIDLDKEDNMLTVKLLPAVEVDKTEA